VTQYDKRPVVQIDDPSAGCDVGWPTILQRLGEAGDLCIECYPGAPVRQIVAAFRDADPEAEVIDTAEFFYDAAAIEAALAPVLGDDPVFARFVPIGIDTFVDPEAVERWRADRQADKRLIVIGPGAAHVMPTRDGLLYVSMARWELQQRQRRQEIGNLGLDNLNARPAEKYRRAFFVDWRVGDRIKWPLIPEARFILEMNGPEPKMIAGDAYLRALGQVIDRPFRVVPFFDAGPWGGQWMRERFDLPDGPPNYAWCFDCVPEENSLLLGFGEAQFEIPALDLVHLQTMPLLGLEIVRRFGAEFPIRFDLLDTMEGGNLSLQVHPQTEYAREAFNISYTQDESYYILDAGPDATVYLGLTDSANPADFSNALKAAEDGRHPLDVEKYVNRLPAKRHDHFLIPAGTIHCSGRNVMVLEISATPYIFTFKLWDWNRLGLDGRPRPTHLQHGLANLDWSRREAFTQDQLVNRVEPVASGADWSCEKTGLHPLEFIETERFWFGSTIELNTGGTVNVLNLVAGDAACVESPSRAFEPFEVHFAETFIVPAGVGPFRIRAADGDGVQCAVMRAYVRLPVPSS
jgi:mannose-6-phosphate isomerase class I